MLAAGVIAFVVGALLKPPRPARPLGLTALRPAPEVLIACDDAPKDAVLTLPAALEAWAKIYCGKSGHFLTSRQGYIAVPRISIGTAPLSYTYELPAVEVEGGAELLAISAGKINGAAEDAGHRAYFKAIIYTAVENIQERNQLIAATQIIKLGNSATLYTLSLVTNNDQSLRLLVDIGDGGSVAVESIDPQRPGYSEVLNMNPKR